MKFLILLGVLAAGFIVFRYLMTSSLDAVHGRLRRSTHRVEVLLPVEAQRMAALLGVSGSGSKSNSQPYALIDSTVRSGFAGLNPAQARIEIWDDPAGSRVVVETEAREGLIDQQTAPRAAERVIAEIQAIAARNGT